MPAPDPETLTTPPTPAASDPPTSGTLSATGSPPDTPVTDPSLIPGLLPEIVAPPGYAIEGELGAGAMGVVYMARHTALNRTVALKVVRAGGRADRRELARFLAEAEAVAAVRHPHVVQVYDSGAHAGQPYIALEFLPGGTLSERLRVRGPLPPADAAALLEKIARGVQAAHEQGIVHRDLKPGNVLLDAAGEPKVADFGLAKRAAVDLTATEAVMGTPAYMAPEQAEGRAKFVGPPADVWALGVILYQALTGRRPFDGDSVEAVLARVLLADPPGPRRVTPGVPRDLERVCLRCLEKDPRDRYPTAGELADDLGRVCAGEPVSVRAAGLAERGLKWVRRRPTAAAAYALAVVAALLLAVAGTVAALWRDAAAARDQAETDRKAAVAAKVEADRLRGLADEAAGREADARRRLADASYLYVVQSAYRAVGAKKPVEAKALLDGCPAPLRGWEWHFVNRQAAGAGSPPPLRPGFGPVAGVTFSPDGWRLAAVSARGDLVLWDTLTGAELGRAEGGGRAAGDVELAFSPDGSTVTAHTRGDRRRIGVWDGRTGRPTEDVRAVADDRETVTTPDGRRRVVPGADGAVSVRDTVRLQEALSLRGHAGRVTCAAFDPAGRRIASGGEDGRVIVWDGTPVPAAR